MSKRLVSSRKTKTITIPDVGNVVVKQLNASDLLVMLEWAKTVDPNTPMLMGIAKAITYSCFDEQGERVFDPGTDTQLVADLPGETFAELAAPVREFNPTIFPAVSASADATGNPVGNAEASLPNDDSPSGLPQSSESTTSM